MHRLVRLIAAFTMIAGLGSSFAAEDDAALCAKTAAADQAIAACTRMIRSGNSGGRDLSAAYRNRGMAWRHKGDRPRALGDFDQAVRLDPHSAEAFFQRAVTWAADGDRDRALSDYDEAIRVNPNYAPASNNRGVLLRDRGDLDRAMADFDQAIRSNPKYALALSNRCDIWRRKRDYERGIADCDQAIRFDPKLARALQIRALIWAEKRQYDRATADCDQAIRINPKDANAHVDCGLVWKAKGSLDRAISDYTEAIRLDPKNAVAHADRGIVWRSKRELDKAIADFAEATRLDPEYPAAFTLRGLAYEAKGLIDEARDDFNSALRLPPKYGTGKWALDTARARLAVLSRSTAPSAPDLAVQTPAKDVSPAAPSQRLALVIGNGAYVHAPALPNPPTDARAVADTLRSIGFSVIAATDLDRARMEAVILDFLRQAASARIAVLFYAGHGVQIDGRNYLVPVDAGEISKNTVSFELVDVDRILAGLDDETRANVILLDACRDNPLESHVVASRSGSRGSGLAPYGTVASGMLIAFATAPGKTARDGSGPNSPFAAALLKYLKVPNLEVNQMLTRVRIDVVNATEREQVPWVNSSLLGDVFLNDGRAAQVKPIAR